VLKDKLDKLLGAVIPERVSHLSFSGMVRLEIHDLHVESSEQADELVVLSFGLDEVVKNVERQDDVKVVFLHRLKNRLSDHVKLSLLRASQLLEKVEITFRGFHRVAVEAFLLEPVGKIPPMRADVRHGSSSQGKAVAEEFESLVTVNPRDMGKIGVQQRSIDLPFVSFRVVDDSLAKILPLPVPVGHLNGNRRKVKDLRYG